MAEMKSRPNKPERAEKTTITVPRTLVAKLKAIAHHHQETIPESLVRCGGPGIDKAFREVNAELGGES